MKRIETVDAKGTLAEYTANLGNDPVIVTDHGRPVAALVPVKNADLETVSLSSSPSFLEIIERSRARAKAEGGISSDEMRRRLQSTIPESGKPADAQ